MPSTSMVASALTDPWTVSRCWDPLRAPPTFDSLTRTPGTSALSAAKVRPEIEASNRLASSWVTCAEEACFCSSSLS